MEFLLKIVLTKGSIPVKSIRKQSNLCFWKITQRNKNKIMPSKLKSNSAFM